MNQITKHDVLRVYGTHQAAADVLGIVRHAVSMWPDGPIPDRHALRLRYEIHPEAFSAAAIRNARRRKGAKA